MMVKKYPKDPALRSSFPLTLWKYSRKLTPKKFKIPFSSLNKRKLQRKT